MTAVLEDSRDQHIDPVEGRVATALGVCAAGDPAGIDQIMAEEGGRLLGVARRMLGRGALAEEAVQDAMVQVWRKAAAFRGDGGSARGWVYAILRNRCLNILRDERRLSTLSHTDLSTLQDARQHVAETEAWELLPGSSRLRECLAELDARSRHAILLAYAAGYSQGEVAAFQGVPLGTAKAWIRRGLVSLRGCLT
ncbi:sigma-70 family RNA polymerase sigma factor [Falsirhodobacter sp. alg1]|uniref:sigma-70 family RNA polymerase sigma factor n=1 Tax=Falsirhodobacter sp. alg1 TaxID=1472418 RepID=UPI001ED9E37E|nr:sigma-70 family RNA polymerase sigma factor [Falsirhodobacter sp. alg1]